jgi:uncharacterized protein YcbK (DUF882 family)
MAKHFTMAELTRSDTAIAKGLDNSPGVDATKALRLLIERALDPVREMWGAPLIVNSGFRCPELNKAVGGAASSQHMRGEAADITTGTVAGNKLLFDKMVAAQKRGEISFDQLIDESSYSWLHVSYRAAGNRNQILHL